MKRCVIVCAGDLAPGILAEYTPEYFYIAADGGYRYLKEADRIPDLFIGDMDSLDPSLRSDVATLGEDRCHILPVQKDDTDCLAAIRVALQCGMTEIHILGGTGGTRSDHTMANYQCLYFIRKMGGRGVLRDLTRDIYVLENESMMIHGEYRKGMSLFSFGDRIGNVTLQGFRYPLTKGVLENCFPLGVSNDIVEETCRIDVQDGCALVFLER